MLNGKCIAGFLILVLVPLPTQHYLNASIQGLPLPQLQLVQILNTYTSQDSVVTCWMCGGTFNYFKFLHECASERIFKISQYFVKI